MFDHRGAWVVMKKVLLAGVALLLAAPAIAADLPTKKAPVLAPPPAEYNWTGIFIGGNLGWSWGNSNYNSYNALNGALVEWGSEHSNTFRGGVQGGYNYEFANRIVIGAAASIDWNDGDKHNGWSADYKNQWQTSSRGFGGDVVARAGYAFGDFLPYALGGWAWTNANVTRTQLLGKTGGLVAFNSTGFQNFPNSSESVNASRSGWTIGAGLLYHVWGPMQVFAQYNYTSFGSKNLVFQQSQRLVHDGSLTSNALTLGANVQF